MLNSTILCIYINMEIQYMVYKVVGEELLCRVAIYKTKNIAYSENLKKVGIVKFEFILHIPAGT